MLTPI
jgi:hypothetical protein